MQETPRHTRRISISIPTQLSWTFPELVAMTAIFAGCQFAWAAQIGYATPALRELGMSSANVSLAWLAGPISGIFMQPIVGIWSDHCSSRFGRRRPFLLFGALFTVIGLFFFGNAKPLGILLGDTSSHHFYGVIIAIVSLWFLDFSVNIAQAPVRALIPDLVPSHQHQLANAAVAFNNGLGKSLGYLCGSLNLPLFSSNIQAVYMIGILVMFLATCSTMRFAKESPRKSLSQDPRNALQLVAHGLRSISTLPKPIARAFVVQFCNYFAWYCVFIYLTTWFGEVLLHGDADETSPSHSDYDTGVAFGNIALLGMSVCSSFASALLPWLMEHANLYVLWTSIQLVFLGGLVSLVFVRDVLSAILIVSLAFGFHFASLYVIAWWIVTSSMQTRSERGLFSAVFNLCQCLPDFAVALLAAPFLKIVGGDLSLIFALAAIGPVAACVAIYFVVLPGEDWGEQEDVEPLLTHDHGEDDSVSFHEDGESVPTYL